MKWGFDEIKGFIPRAIPLPYSREEKNGYRSILTGRDELNYIMLNGSGSYILSLCDKKHRRGNLGADARQVPRY